MNEKNAFELVRRPASTLEKAGGGTGRIQSAIVADTLALARKQQSMPAATSLRIGDYDWCEPDHRVASASVRGP
jgi:hypothetical protein